MRSVDNVVTDNDQVLRKRLYEESPWWVPESIDDRVFDKIRGGVTSLMAEVLADPDHDIRQLFDQRARTVAVELRESEGLAARGEELKAELLDHPDVRAWLSSLWEHLKVGLLEAADDPTATAFESEVLAAAWALERGTSERHARGCLRAKVLGFFAS